MPFQCTVVTPEQQVVDAQAQQVILPAVDGQLGILTGRAPLLATLGAGQLRVDLSSGQKQSYFVNGGVAQMKDNKLTILTNEATPADEISAEVARTELAEATARQVTDLRSADERRKAMDAARAKQQMARG